MEPFLPDINLFKTQTKINAYNLLQVGMDTGKYDDDQVETKENPKETANQRDTNWRHMPTCDMDLMIISSFGDEWDPSIKVVLKQQDNATSMNGKIVGARKEMEAIIDQCRRDKRLFLQDVCPDFPGAQLSKDDHIDRIKQFFQKCEKDGVVVWYTGNGEENTGNWCFKDGVITFQDIFGLYMDCFRGKRLTIVSDCSYSGNWKQMSARVMDELGIPACGHHSRDQRILLKCFCSCQHDQEATLMALINKVELNDKGSIIFPFKELESGQIPCYSDFRMIRCSKIVSESCELGDLPCKWEDRLFNKSRFVYLVRGKDRGRQAWHYIMVDEDKVEAFKSKIISGTIDVADYGKVLKSGWGENPPKDISSKIDLRFLPTISPE